MFMIIFNSRALFFLYWNYCEYFPVNLDYTNLKGIRR